MRALLTIGLLVKALENEGSTRYIAEAWGVSEASRQRLWGT